MCSSDLPTIAESGVPGYELAVQYGLFAPARTPPSIVTSLNREVAAIVAGADVREKLAADGGEPPAPHTPSEMAAALARDVARWDRFFKSTTIRFD